MSKLNVKADVVDNTLVVSFLSKKEPRVWRMDMGRFLSTSLEVREGDGRFILVMKTGPGAAEEVGAFPDRKRAVETLDLITAALLRGSGGVAAALPPKSGSFFGWLFGFIFKVIFALLVASAVFIGVGRMTGKLPAMPEQVQSMQEMTPAPTAPQKGVPVPADSVLGH